MVISEFFRKLPLPADEVHLWWAFTSQINNQVQLDRQFQILSKAEQTRFGRFTSDEAKVQYLVSHALVRDVLSRYAPVRPEDWRFSANEFGKPSIARESGISNLRFSLSHTKGRVVVAIAHGKEIGVDVECTETALDPIEIGNCIFSPPEIDFLRLNPDAFFEVWTLKEAFSKACGMGLSLPLDYVTFSFAERGKPRICSLKGNQDQIDCWQFILNTGSDYQMALVVLNRGGVKFRLVEWECEPLNDYYVRIRG